MIEWIVGYFVIGIVVVTVTAAFEAGDGYSVIPSETMAAAIIWPAVCASMIGDLIRGGDHD